MIRPQHATFLACALLIAPTLSCSNVQLDAFTRQTQTTAEGGGAGTGGGGASAGTGGVAGGKASGGSSGNGSGPLLIDDLEDGDNQTLIPGGWWYMQGDPTGAVQSEFGGETTRAGSATRAVRATGSGFKSWFFVGVDLPGQPNFNASAYLHVTFWARAEPASIVRSLSVDVLDSTSVNVQDSTALHFRSSVELTTDWTNYSLAFKDFVPTDGDPAARVNRAELSTLEFWIFSADSFDFWIDDLTLAP